MASTRVLIVDDSSFMRRAIQDLLKGENGIEVIGTARDGVEAVKKVVSLRPDVVTMDVEMPRMNGLEALNIIMHNNPVPVLMVSSLTEEGARATLDALEMGAVDYIPKHLGDLSVNIFRIKSELVAKIKAVSGKRILRTDALLKSLIAEHSINEPSNGSGSKGSSGRGLVMGRMAMVAIGASTGGPSAVRSVINSLPANLEVCVLVVQHMPKNFTAQYAERLDHTSPLSVKEAEDGDMISPGKVFVAPGGLQTVVRKRGALNACIETHKEPVDAIYKPSVDISFCSIAQAFPGRAVAVILTGMGADGTKGVREIKASGGKCIAQDESSSIVYGMPKSVADAGLADKVTSISDMAGEILNMS